MAQSSWPSPTSSRTVTDLQYEQLVAPQYVDGLIGSPTDAALVTADGSGMHVVLAASRYGQVRGHAWTSGASTVTLTISANSSGSTRTDLVVLGLDRSTWNATAYVKNGTPGSGAPALQTDTGDTGIFEIPLAEVTVLNGASAISSGQVKARHWWVRPDGVASASTNTRPPSPSPGMRMWESGTAYVWNGSIWERVSNGPTPVQSTQTTILSGLTGASGIGDDSTWRSFSSSVWLPLTFVVPPTGRVYVTVSGWVENRASTSSSMWLSYFSTGGGMTSGLDPDVMDARAVSTRASRVVASNRKLYTGLTPGATVTLTPAYNSTTASTDANVSSIRYGNLIMEPA